MNIYEMFGRQAEQINGMREFANRTLTLLRDLKEGAVLPSALVITDSGWQLQEDRNGNEDQEGTEAGNPAS